MKELIWTKRFMTLCNHIAEWSEDPDFQVGCVIISPEGHEIRSTGYNGFARGVKSDQPARYDRKSGEKFFWFEHAERNAIYNAARSGVSLAGCTLYVNRFPCADCGRAIIQAGIPHIVAPPIPVADGALDYSFQVSQQMLCEAGVQITEFE
ncbi:deaminase [Roseibium porphyridii]|uniref:Deaminase n=1 Tax=Roseibium porphyridii TaxID=2866279 RepID=A0ABY8F7D8_9HYPH|nr:MULTISPECIES: deaminase [Stappiaceae]QFT34199.1 tRNA-specific adenosine deaminase [Labrenzia sp. THAF82]WFE89210.1 deaminase [Roseibium sp. KMA01]